MNSNDEQPILSVIKENGVGVVTLNRPARHNAFNDVMIVELTHVLKQMEQNPLVKIVLIKSSGKSFSSGADLEWMRRMANFSLDENLKDAGALNELMHTIYYCQKPTVAMVQGGTFGGGVGLVACCHIVIASTEAAFCFSEVKLGLIPAIISPYVINAIGARHARSYYLTAQPFDAHVAHRIGLCHEVVSPELLESRTEHVIANLLNNGPHAMRAVNSLFNKLALTPEIINLTVQKLVEARTSSEGKEGLSAFLEKRKPKWASS